MDKFETLEFQGRTLYFKVREWSGEYGSHYTTQFYLELKTKKVKKYWFFGPLVDVPDNEMVFEINCDVKNPYYSKQDIRKKIQEKLDIYNRSIEIKNGKYV